MLIYIYGSLIVYPAAQTQVKRFDRPNKEALRALLGIWNQNFTTAYYGKCCSVLSISIFNCLVTRQLENERTLNK